MSGMGVFEIHCDGSSISMVCPDCTQSVANFLSLPVWLGDLEHEAIDHICYTDEEESDAETDR